MIVRYRRDSSSIAIFVLTLLLFSPTTSASTQPIPHDKEVYIRGDESRLHGPITRAKRPEYVAHPAGELVCRPFGECEPCPVDERHQPFCMPFGNRRLLHCLPAASHHAAHDTPTNAQPAGEVPAWEACGKVVKKERQDFWEFVTANLLFLIVAMTVLWARTSALAAQQYRQLAARIGIPGGTWRT